MSEDSDFLGIDDDSSDLVPLQMKPRRKRKSTAGSRKIIHSWLDDQIFTLIAFVKSRRRLWDSNSPEYQLPKADAWRSVAEELAIKGVDANEAKIKWASLRTTFTTNLSKVRQSRKSKDPHTVTWKYFKYMMFLIPVQHSTLSKTTPTPRSGFDGGGTSERNNFIEIDDVKPFSNPINDADELDESELTVLAFEDVDLPCTSSLASSPAPAPISMAAKRRRTSELLTTQPENKKLLTPEDALNDVLGKMRKMLAEFYEKKEKSYLSSSLDAIQMFLMDLPKDLQDACILDMFKKIAEAKSEAQARTANSTPCKCRSSNKPD